MAQINLLPWRDERRKQLSQQFARQAVLAAVLAAVVGGFAWYHVGGLIEAQRERNEYLQKEIQVLQKEIEEIRELEKVRDRLIARMEVIQRLQQRRPQIVHLFFELADTLPDGVYLTQVTQEGNKLTVHGRAESNARVSSYMRKLNASQWLKNPELEVIEAQDPNEDGAEAEINSFTLRLAQATPDGGQQDSASGAAASGGGGS